MALHPRLSVEEEKSITRMMGDSRERIADLKEMLARFRRCGQERDRNSLLRECICLLELVRITKSLSALRERFITANLRLVVYLAGAFSQSGLPLLELIQEGNRGLVIAAEKFDYRRGVRFCTYARWWIRRGMESFGEKRQKMMEISLEEPSYGKKDDDAVNLVIDYYDHKRLSQALARLPDRTRYIMEQSWGLGGILPKTFREIGKELKVSHARVQQIEKDGVAQLRRLFPRLSSHTI